MQLFIFAQNAQRISIVDSLVPRRNKTLTVPVVVSKWRSLRIGAPPSCLGSPTCPAEHGAPRQMTLKESRRRYELRSVYKIASLLSFLAVPLLVLGAFAKSDNSGHTGYSRQLCSVGWLNRHQYRLQRPPPGNAWCQCWVRRYRLSPGNVSGAISACNGSSAQAQLDLTKAYNAAMGMTRTAT